MTDAVMPDPRLPPADADDGAGDEDLVTVRVLAAPLVLWDEAAQHTDELLREFSLLSFGLDQGGHAVPVRLLELVAALQARYAGISEEPEQERLAALAAGRTSLDLTYRVPPAAGPACQQLRDLLDEADDYCRQGTLMTLATPPEQKRFRDWYLGEFVRQLEGEPPVVWSEQG